MGCKETGMTEQLPHTHVTLGIMQFQKNRPYQTETHSFVLVTFLQQVINVSNVFICHLVFKEEGQSNRSNYNQVARAKLMFYVETEPLTIRRDLAANQLNYLHRLDYGQLKY